MGLHRLIQRQADPRLGQNAAYAGAVLAPPEVNTSPSGRSLERINERSRAGHTCHNQACVGIAFNFFHRVDHLDHTPARSQDTRIGNSIGSEMLKWSVSREFRKGCKVLHQSDTLFGKASGNDWRRRDDPG